MTTVGPPSLDGFVLEDEVDVYEEAVGALSSGMLELWQPQLDSLQSTLHEISEAQSALLQTVNKEKNAIVDNEDFVTIADVMAKVPAYSHKLDTLRKDMASLQEKSKKLMKRADKLVLKKNQKMEDAAKKQQEALEREKKLLAMPAVESLVVKSSTQKPKRSSSKSKIASAEPEDQIIVVNPGPSKANANLTSK
eukprot:m.20540 g.20540  ORF g.20540 m.20540 type:complete len:194 (-) comp5259_c0_seq2:90-671(-)